VECQALLECSTGQQARSDQGNLEAKLAGLQLEQQAAARKASDLAGELAGSKALCSELQQLAERREAECAVVLSELEEQRLKSLEAPGLLGAAPTDAVEARLEAAENELQAQAEAADEAKEAHESELASARQALHAQRQEAAQQSEEQKSLTEELKRLQEESKAAEESAESLRQLLRALQQKTAEQEQEAQLREEDLQRLKEAACSSQPEAPKLVPSVPADSPGAGDAGGTADAAEEVIFLRDRISDLERQNDDLRTKLEEPPTADQGVAQKVVPEGPVRRTARADGNTSSPQSEANGTLSLQKRLVLQTEEVLLTFTKRLMRRDAWLWLFYAHLLVLYTMVAICMAHSSDPLATGEVHAQMVESAGEAERTTGGFLAVRDR